MNESDKRKNDLSPNNVSAQEFVEQDVSDEEIAEYAGRFIQEGREILLSWLEFQNEALRQFFLKEYRGDFTVKFQRGNEWFSVSAGEGNLDITWADNEDALEEDWNEEGGRMERVHARSISIVYNEKPFRSDKPNGALFYEGPELKIPTRGFVMPANTKAVVEQIEKSFAELRKL